MGMFDARYQRAAVVIAGAGLALSGGIAAAMVRDKPDECRASPLNEDVGKRMDATTGWHPCTQAEIESNQSPDVLGDVLAGRVIDKRAGGADFSIAQLVFALGSLLTGIAVAVLWGLGWARRGS